MRLELKQNQKLHELNSFQLPAVAEYFCEVRNHQDILEANAYAQSRNLPVWVLGGGSNVVLCGNIPGLCLHLAIAGRDVDHSQITLGAGENWHETVLYTLDAELYGLENLALIPGQVGAAPIQNIGAYGVELAEFVVSVSGIDLTTNEPFSFSQADCQFGYRDSIFKQSRQSQWIITSLQLSLSPTFEPRLDYAGIETQLGQHEVTANNVCRAIVELRTAKLPDPRTYGNAGSFFKNPILDPGHFESLSAQEPRLKSFADPNGIKVSAAQLIELCGLKGARVGNVRISTRHALVLENAGGASGDEVLLLAKHIQAEVKARFNIMLEIEPRVMPRPDLD